MKLLSLSLAILTTVSALKPSSPVISEKKIPPSVQFYDGNDTKMMTVEDYVTGVVLHEMPYTFHREALRAQAVAARTYLYYCLNNNSHPHENGADVCADIFHCCGYTTASAISARFGDTYAEAAITAVREAVYSTAGEVMLYDSEEILAVWHSSSGDSTEDCGEIWLCQLPYLASVNSPEEFIFMYILSAISLSKSSDLSTTPSLPYFSRFGTLFSHHNLCDMFLLRYLLAEPPHLYLSS